MEGSWRASYDFGAAEAGPYLVIDPMDFKDSLSGAFSVEVDSFQLSLVLSNWCCFFPIDVD